MVFSWKDVDFSSLSQVNRSAVVVVIGEEIVVDDDGEVTSGTK
jgi:hypothetical protein